ncbi:MAG: hypothetical protein ACOCXP_01000, partial [Candidatus Dojkabacteria bacterium]
MQELVFNFPIWWYWDRYLELVRGQSRYLANLAYYSGFTINLRYLFVPIYQQYNLIGRFVSLLFRLG